MMNEAPDGDTAIAADEGSEFAALGLRPELLGTLAALGYETPTPIQRETIPLLLGGQDLLGQAATGTGKTAAFALPVINNIGPGQATSPVALVLVPTRELAMQVSDAILAYGKDLHIRVAPVYGGQPIYHQLQALKRGVHIVVATPGRAIDHIRRGSLALDGIRTVILDEADEMLDMGFTEDIETILETTPADRQTVLFSATMPPRINSIAKRYQRDPLRIQIGRKDASEEKVLVRQTVYFVARHHKAAALGRILDIEAPQSTLVFCTTRTDVDELTVTMNGRGYRAEALHGGMDQNQRDRVMSRLRDGTAQLLVATDVAARGLDVDALSHVVNYDVPTAPESYVHRIGRVGRAGREGVAITLAAPNQRRLLANIERLTKTKMSVEKVPSVADLRTRQIELTVTAVREALSAEDLDDYNGVLHGLAGEHNDRNIALAAIKLVHDAQWSTADEVEIPDVSEHHSPKYDGNQHGGHRKGVGRGQQDGSKGGHGRGRPGPKGKPGSAPPPGTGSVYIGLGRKAGIRPGDLVGAIANETNLAGGEIGPIRIADHFSVVGVPEESVDTVIQAIQTSMVRGKKAKARRFVD